MPHYVIGTAVLSMWRKNFRDLCRFGCCVMPVDEVSDHYNIACLLELPFEILWGYPQNTIYCISKLNVIKEWGIND